MSTKIENILVKDPLRRFYRGTRSSAKVRQRRLQKFLRRSSIDPATYAGMLGCTATVCGRDACIVGCAFGDRRRRGKHLPKVHKLLAGTTGPVFEVRLSRSSWARKVGELHTASILAAKQMTRRELDKLYYPKLVAVGTYKPACFMIRDEAVWVCGVHLLVAGVGGQSDLERVFGGSWQRIEQPSELSVRRVVDLSEAIKRTFATGFEWWGETIALSKKEKQRLKTNYLSWLFSQKPDERVIRYGCDRHFNKLKKKPRIFKTKAPPRKRPYPHWLEHYMFGGELRSGQLSDFVPGSKKADRQFKRRNPLVAAIYDKANARDDSIDPAPSDEDSADDLPPNFHPVAVRV